METRDLRTFVTVVASSSFTRAADALGYTQSAVSQQIASLEAELGRPLLHRRPVRPTAAGSRLAEHAQRILLRMDVARSEIEQLDRESIRLTVVAAPLAAPGILPTAITVLRLRAPSLSVRVVTAGTDDAVRALAAGEADVALVCGASAPDEPLGTVDAGLMTALPLAEVPLVIALPVDHPLARRRHLDLAVLADAPWIDAPHLSPSPVRAGRLVASPGVDTGSVRYDGHDTATLLALVAAGHGATLLPASACQSQGVVGVAVRDGTQVLRTELLSLRTLTERQELLATALRAGSTYR